MRATRFLSGAGVLAAVLGIAVTTVPSVALAGSKTPSQWTYRADVSGDGSPDSITIRAGKDLVVHNGFGTGHFKVNVSVSFSNGSFGVVRRMHVDGYYGGTGADWTPWLGAAQVDQHGGDDLVLGFTTGAHSQSYNVLALRPDRRLVKLGAPGAGPPDTWGIGHGNDGSFGYRCTDKGVETRVDYPNSDFTRYTIDKTWWVRESGDWSKVRHTSTKVDAQPNGDPPTYTNKYSTFACNGLPTY